MQNHFCILKVWSKFSSVYTLGETGEGWLLGLVCTIFGMKVAIPKYTAGYTQGQNNMRCRAKHRLNTFCGFTRLGCAFMPIYFGLSCQDGMGRLVFLAVYTATPK